MCRTTLTKSWSGIFGLLEAADLVTDDRARQAGATSPVAGFCPSLHLNLGEVYRKLGDTSAARRHLEAGQAAIGTLSDEGYATMIKNGCTALAVRMSTD